MQVTLRHASTGDRKTVGTGWNWLLFMTSGFLGLPLFFRGLALWGAVVMLVWCLTLLPRLIGDGSANSEMFDWAFTIALTALCVFFGLKGNALIARRYISLGYEFTDPDSIEARIARQSWGL